ncbi:hypothetical protein ACHAXT_012872 [Thalassiosira profunda]
MRAHALFATLLLAPDAAALSATSSTEAIIRSFELRGEGLDPNTSCTVHEVRCPPRDPDAEEDEVEMLYPTTRRAFVIPGYEEKLLNIRQTSFGCGRLGATVWPSAIALSSLLANECNFIEGKRVMELGSGCGLPSLVAKEICSAESVLATDYWEVADDADRLVPADAATEGRLVPKDIFRVNLEYNIHADDSASVGRLDWHDEMEIFKTANECEPDVIVGSDLVYYPLDTEPLLQTLNILLKGGKPKDALLVLPLPPSAEREALPDFRKRLEQGALGDKCRVVMDEMEMVETQYEEQRHNMLRIQIHSAQK